MTTYEYIEVSRHLNAKNKQSMVSYLGTVKWYVASHVATHFALAFFVAEDSCAMYTCITTCSWHRNVNST